MPEISIREIAEEIDMLGDGWSAYLNRRTGELYSFTSEDECGGFLDDEEMDQEGADLQSLPGWQREAILKRREISESDDWLPLPDKFHVHEWSIMNDFTQSIADDDVRQQLLRAIHGTGAFRYFKDLVFQHGIRDQWHQFKLQALERIAADWLDARGVTIGVEDPPASAHS
jgi:hypothetical protein